MGAELFLQLFTEISCRYENKTVTLRHRYLKQLIMKQVEERYISLLTDKVFDRLFEEAEIAKFTPQEMREYEADKKAYRDIKNSIDTAKREGIEIGKAEGKNEVNTETAQRLLAMGLSAEQVAKATQLPLEIIKNLSNS
ncbi:PD-(D/E)XK nuclease family transposase [Segatella copri]|uniref:PD-(D/E)XK nuclease family transposase n=1 Tax=Segatella copri TaxID=165179 RepID=UPI00294B2EB8|nr:PD-(D/E)XK nuclease family transposase [Segatella copri]WOG32693.1 PD-(D/E)XK nuclease family transposase [Segatella copri]